MSSFDFAMTIAIGSLFASTIANKNPSLIIGLTALAVLYAGQWIIAALRRRIPAVSLALDNRPLLLMEGSQILDKNMEQARVTRADLYAKLREANVLSLESVRAVVFETTGDVSVLHASDPAIQPDPELLSDVIQKAPH